MTLHLRHDWRRTRGTRPRRRATLLILGLGLVAVPQALAAPLFTLTGRGYGHGIGMSQYGAQGMAMAGQDYRAILGRYYGGAVLSPSPQARIRVLLTSRARVSIAAPAAATTLAIDAGPAGALPEPAPPGPTPTPPGTVPPAGRPAGAAGAELALEVRVVKGALVLADARGGTRATGTRLRLEAPEPLAVGGDRYRGALVLTLDGDQVRVVNELPLDDYVRGVVARESPSYWRPAALQAQSVAARTYALAVRKPTGEFDVYPDVRSQVYGGVAAETDATDAAVAATAGRVLTHDGRIASTYFYSSSGGRTAALQDVWGGSPVAYLRSVADPEDRISPYHRWTPVELGARALGRFVGLPAVRDVALVVNPSRRVTTATFTAPNGTTRSWSGAALRTRMGLRSSWFRIAMVDLRSVRRVGGRIVLEGRAAPGGHVAVLGRGADGTWRRLALGATTPTGAIRAVVPARDVRALRLRVAGAFSGVARAPRPPAPAPPAKPVPRG